MSGWLNDIRDKLVVEAFRRPHDPRVTQALVGLLTDAGELVGFCQELAKYLDCTTDCQVAEKMLDMIEVAGQRLGELKEEFRGSRCPHCQDEECSAHQRQTGDTWHTIFYMDPKEKRQ